MSTAPGPAGPRARTTGGAGPATAACPSLRLAACRRTPPGAPSPCPCGWPSAWATPSASGGCFPPWPRAASSPSPSGASPGTSCWPACGAGASTPSWWRPTCTAWRRRRSPSWGGRARPWCCWSPAPTTSAGGRSPGSSWPRTPGPTPCAWRCGPPCAASGHGRAPRGSPAPPAREAADTAAPPPPAAPPGLGVIVVAGGPGGPGRTTVAVSLAAALGAVAPTVLVDADLSGPSVAVHLNLDWTRNLYMLAHAGPATRGEWERAIAQETQPLGPRSPHGVALCGVPKPAMRAAVSAGFLERLVAELRRRYRYVVVDVGADLLGPEAACAPGRGGAGPARPARGGADLAGLWHARTALGLLRTHVPVAPERVALVVTRHDRRHHQGRAEIEWALRVPAAAVVPYDHGAAQRALAAQRPLVLEDRSRAGRALLDLAERIHAGGPIRLPQAEGNARRSHRPASPARGRRGGSYRRCPLGWPRWRWASWRGRGWWPWVTAGTAARQKGGLWRRRRRRRGDGRPRRTGRRRVGSAGRAGRRAGAAGGGAGGGQPAARRAPAPRPRPGGRGAHPGPHPGAGRGPPAPGGAHQRAAPRLTRRRPSGGSSTGCCAWGSSSPTSRTRPSRRSSATAPTASSSSATARSAWSRTSTSTTTRSCGPSSSA